jgi:tRNA (guanine37-N1)-methyltransferase
MRIAVVTLFPVMIREALAHGVVGRAAERGVLEVECFDPRDYTTDAHRTVDDRPYGGGPGMVLKVEPLRSAIRAAAAAQPPGSQKVYLGADGQRFEQGTARSACAAAGLILVAGRYEGVDERCIERETDARWSIGDYVLSGGEVAAMVLIDACVRLLPGVMGAVASRTEESFTEGLLEYPQYTRPQLWEGQPIPEVLLSGDHGKIAAWRRSQAEQLTRERRPDLWARHSGARVKPAKPE